MPEPAKTYSPSARLREQIDRSFTYHKPSGDQPERYVALRFQARQLAMTIAELTPESREQSLALTKLEEAVMFANAAIARNEGEADDQP